MIDVASVSERRQRHQARHERLVPVGERVGRGAQGPVVVIVVAAGAHRAAAADDWLSPPRRSCPACPSSFVGLLLVAALLARAVARRRRPRSAAAGDLVERLIVGRARSCPSSGRRCRLLLVLAGGAPGPSGMYWSGAGESLWACAAGAAMATSATTAASARSAAYRVKRVTSQTLPRTTRRGPPAGRSARLQWSFGHRSSCPRNGRHHTSGRCLLGSGARDPGRGGVVGRGGGRAPAASSRARRFRVRRWSPALPRGAHRVHRALDGLGRRRRRRVRRDPARGRATRGCSPSWWSASPARSARSWLAGLAIGLVALSVAGARQPDDPVAVPGAGPARRSCRRRAGG